MSKPIKQNLSRRARLWCVAGCLVWLAPAVTSAMPTDSVAQPEAAGLSQEAAPADTVSKRPLKDNWWTRLIYGNKDRSFEKRFDVSFLPAPTYSIESQLGLGGILSALYRLDRHDSVMPPSDVSVGGKVSITGFYAIQASGNNYFPGRRHRLSYRTTFANKPLDFWGISYQDCVHNPVSKYTRQSVLVDVDYAYRAVSRLFVGASFEALYMSGQDVKEPAYLQGQRRSYYFTGLGVSVSYDSRDFLPNPQRGIYFLLKEMVFPSVLSTYHKTLFQTTLTFDAYQRVWKGGCLAFDFYGRLNPENAPWPLREQVGSGVSRMRGYYEGKYTDCSQLSTQLELRQRVWKRLGLVAWGGGGIVFPALHHIRDSHFLPNYGVGVRFEFKHNMNLRVDYGFGRDTRGVVFGFGEAF